MTAYRQQRLEMRKQEENMKERQSHQHQKRQQLRQHLSEKLQSSSSDLDAVFQSKVKQNK